MVTTKDLMRASVVGEELIEEGFERGVEHGIEQGIEKGIERGRQMTRRHIRGLLASRIPSAIDSAWLDSIGDIDRLDRLFDELLAARDEAEARAALERTRTGQ